MAFFDPKTPPPPSSPPLALKIAGSNIKDINGIYRLNDSKMKMNGKSTYSNINLPYHWIMFSKDGNFWTVANGQYFGNSKVMGPLLTLYNVRDDAEYPDKSKSKSSSIWKEYLLVGATFMYVASEDITCEPISGLPDDATPKSDNFSKSFELTANEAVLSGEERSWLGLYLKTKDDIDNFRPRYKNDKNIVISFSTVGTWVVQDLENAGLPKNIKLRLLATKDNTMHSPDHSDKQTWLFNNGRVKTDANIRAVKIKSHKIGGFGKKTKVNTQKKRLKIIKNTSIKERNKLFHTIGKEVIKLKEQIKQATRLKNNLKGSYFTKKIAIKK